MEQTAEETFLFLSLLYFLDFCFETSIFVLQFFDFSQQVFAVFAGGNDFLLLLCDVSHILAREFCLADAVEFLVQVVRYASRRAGVVVCHAVTE